MRQALVITGIFLCLSLTLPSQAGTLREVVAEDYPSLLALYKDLHSHPELSFEEVQTASRIAKEMAGLGFEVTEQVGGTGVVSVLKNGDGPVVMIRTDMDALPVAEQTGLAYASTARAVNQVGQEVSVMHACGHDVHMTVFIGTARQLVRLKDEWRGTLVMIAQPAEERGAGARNMLGDGLFERFPRPDFNLALHVSPTLTAGKIGYIPEYGFANVDSVDITVFGIGGHGAYPHMTKDPVVLAAQIVTGLQTLVSREISPLDPGVITVGSIHGGTKHNVISDRVDMQLTVRTYSDEVRAQLLEGIARIAEGQALAFGMPKDRMPQVKINDEYTPALYNDPDLTKRIAGVLGEQLGQDQVVLQTPVMGGEDFARYGRVEPRIPSLMMRLGAVAQKKIAKADAGKITLPSLHSALFAPVPEPTIKGGVEAMSLAALELLGKP